MSRTIVKTEYLKLELPAGGLRLANGETLPEVTVAFERYGPLNGDQSNVVYVCHALTGDAHAAFYHSEDDKSAGWWDGLIGPGKGIDTNHYHVICANCLGGCKGTTGPSSLNPATGKPYGLDFPLISQEDVVRVERLFLQQLGIQRLHAVIGGSLGGMRALLWALLYPQAVDRCISIAASASLSPLALAFDIIGRQEIEDDPEFADGRYLGEGKVPNTGLSRARQIGHVTYLSPHSMEFKFGREVCPTPIPGKRTKFATNFQIESYLQYKGRHFVGRFDALSYLCIMRMMDTLDLQGQAPTLADAFRQVASRFLIVSISSDWLFPADQQLELVAALLANRKQVSYFQIESLHGHDAFLVEFETLARGVSAFLNGHQPAHLPDDVERMDLATISTMMPDRGHVLDVGSGDGSMLLNLMQTKHATGICLDHDFAMVAACMDKGLSALQFDADSGLGLIPNGAFDCVLVNQTIQQLHSALQSLKQLLRIAPVGVIGFPNFAYYRYRLSLALGGHLPVSRTLPYEWYDTPNIHLITVKDFRALCERHGIEIEAVEYLDDSALGHLLIALGMVNVGAERVLVRLGRGGVGEATVETALAPAPSAPTRQAPP